MRVPREAKMRFLILLQVLTATVNICNAESTPSPVVILSESRTEAAAPKTADSSTASELFDNPSDIEDDGNNLDFDYDDGEDSLKIGGSPDAQEQEMQEVLLKAMRKPAIRKQIGEVIPILRVMSPAQRLTLAAMVSSQIMSQNTLSEENLAEIAAMFSSKNPEDKNDRHNITEHLLLPISMDIAKMFKGLGKEMGRNLRENFYAPHHSRRESGARRVTRKPNFRGQAVADRRMDEMSYEELEAKYITNRSAGDLLKPPGKDECDFFTKNLCLEVANYPTEAIILSLKRNQEIANTFLTDFEVQPTEETFQNSRGQGSSRRLERRQDGQNESLDSAPDGGYMCPSSVKYARPKRARTTSGQWKYIVNAGDYTQTLRLEICQKPKSPCSYITNHLNSECAQIYNYHRLLTWDEGKGLHMDIFKVPSCCSCHIQGYSTFFPPNQDFTFAEKRREPLKPSYPAMELPNRPPLGYVGNKREVTKHVSPGSAFPMNGQNKSLLLGNAKEFFRDPADYLIPPGPPLPLENEGMGNLYSEPKFNQKLGLNPQRDPVQAEYRRIIHKVAEGPDSLKELPLPSSNRLKPPITTPERVNLKFSKTHHPEVLPRTPQETNPIFEPANQMHFLKPSPNAPPPFPHLDNPPAHLPPKFNSKSPPPYFKPGFSDSKALPSKINPSYVTPPRVSVPTRVTTTPTPPKKPDLTASTQKKINYNYHPIIDFFLSETNTKKRFSTYSSPQHSSQDWTPVLGH